MTTAVAHQTRGSNVCAIASSAIPASYQMLGRTLELLGLSNGDPVPLRVGGVVMDPHRIVAIAAATILLLIGARAETRD